jgi:phosphohistidine phosphatase
LRKEQAVDLYLIRHADAVPLGEAGIAEDAARPLSAHGKEETLILSSGLLRQGVRPAIVLTSPLLRARQTAEGFAQGLGEPTVEVRLCRELAPGGKRRRLSRVIKDLGMSTVAAVGHQPDLGEFAAWLIGSKNADIDFAKGGVACIHWEDMPGRPHGELQWLVTPQWLGRPQEAGS